VSLDEENADNPPYFFDVTAFGIVVVDDGMPSDEAYRLACTTTPQTLIGAIREHLASITARGPWGAVFLGTKIMLQSSLPQPNADQQK